MPFIFLLLEKESVVDAFQCLVYKLVQGKLFKAYEKCWDFCLNKNAFTEREISDTDLGRSLS